MTEVNVNMYHFNNMYYHLFNVPVICNSFIKMYSLVSEIWRLKDRQFVSQVASAENHVALYSWRSVEW